MTPTTLYRKTLEKLQVAAAGEPVDADDVQLIRSKYESLYEVLAVKELVSWNISQDIPENCANPVVMMLAFLSASEFGMNPLEFAAEGALDVVPPSIGERQLRAQFARDFNYEPARTEYF